MFATYATRSRVILTLQAIHQTKGLAMATAFDRKMLDAEIVQLSALVTAIKGQQGSAAKRHEAATLEALGTDVLVEDVSVFSIPGPQLPNEGAVTMSLARIAKYVADLNSWAEQAANEAVTVILKGQNDEGKLDALREQYKAKRELCEAYVTVLTSMKIDVSDVEIPMLRGSTGPRTSSAKTSKGRWYRIVKGMRKDQPDSQNTISSFAYYHGAALVGTPGEGSTANGKGVPTDVLEKWLTKNVTEGASPIGRSWSVEVDGVTYGMDVVPDKAGDEEE